MIKFPAIAFALLVGSTSVHAESLTLAPVEVTDWKAVYGRVESRHIVPARARIGGVITELTVSEGDLVSTGQQIGLIKDEKIAFQIASLDAQLGALEAQLRTAEAELARGETLLSQGVVTRQRLGQLSTDVEVTRNQIASIKANRDVLSQQESEGALVAPAAGRVLTVPTSLGAVIMPGEPVANIGSGGFFLRLAIPERFAGELVKDASIRISTPDGETTGRLARLYPLIENGRVIADVEVEGLETAYVNARILVEVPIGKRFALVVPQSALSARHGLDFVTVETGDGTVDRVVVPGRAIVAGDVDGVEIMSGLAAGDKVVLP